MARERPIVYSKLPLPWDWSTCIDGITPLGIQCQPRVAPNAEVFFLKTHISYLIDQTTPPTRVIKTQTGEIKPPSARARQVVPFLCSTDPASRVYTQREILDDILSVGISSGLKVPSAGGIITRQCLRIDRRNFDIPSELEEEGYLEGCTHVLVDNVACSNWPGFLRRNLNVRIPSLTKLMRRELVDLDIVKKHELPVHQRMRSILQMRSVLGMDIDTRKIIPYPDILSNDRGDKVFSEKLSDSLSKDKFFMSTAVPQSLPGFTIDGHPSSPRAYLLKRWNIPAALKLGPEWRP